MAKALDKSWRDWVQNNVARDVPRSELLRILTTEGFDFSAAHRELYPLRVPTLVRLDVEGAELYIESYELETFSTPTLGQRTWTFMLYLNEPEEGGETDFPSLGVTVKPRTGRAVIWNSLKEDGTPNSRTLHHGMQVRKGFKAVITKWFRKPRSAR